MNVYLLALISVIAAFAVGFVIYGQLFQGPLGTKGEKMDTNHILMATIMLYVSSLAFIYLFNHFTIEGYEGITKGVVLGLIAGIGMFALPLWMDAGFFKGSKDAKTAVILNWILSFIVIGVVVGWLS